MKLRYVGRSVGAGRVPGVVGAANTLRVSSGRVSTVIGDDKYNLVRSKLGCFIGSHLDNEDSISLAVLCCIS